jgi:hypothetical protein
VRNESAVDMAMELNPAGTQPCVAEMEVCSATGGGGECL